KILKKHFDAVLPDFAVCAFDLPVPTFRHKMFDQYKANRSGMPEDLAVQMPYAKQAVAALGFTIIEKEGYEADDILGTLAGSASVSGEDIRTLIMTGDRDSLQLISDNVNVLLATNNDYILFDKTAFFEKYGVQPEQFVDVKAIMGDSSDNIPGISGIGEKGALALISQFGSLESVYNNYAGADLKPAMIKKLEAGKEFAFMSQTLARICTSVPDLPDISSFLNEGINKSSAFELFNELEFTALIKKFNLSAEASVHTTEEEFTVKSIDDKEALIGILSAPNASIYFEEGKIYAFNGTFAAECEFDVDCALAIKANAESITAFDVKSIYEAGDAVGVRVRNICDDVMLAAYSLDSQGGHSLEKIVARYLSETLDEKSSKAAYVYRLREKLTSMLDEKNAQKLYREIEMPLASVLADMEEAGFLIDMEGLEAYGAVLKEQAEALAQRIYFLAGEEFNINSPKQLGEILFEKLQLPSGKKTKTGYSTNAEILEKLASKHPIVSDILDYRQLTKLIGTYVTGLLKVASDDGRIRTNFKQTGTATGRLSSSEPNLQNIPVKTDAGRELRKYFLPQEGYKLISADYSQIELRLLACISGDEAMLSAFASGADIHTSTASAVFNVPPEMVTPLLRKRAKAVNFGIVYGIGDYSLSQDLDISIKQAKEYIDSYLNSYPGVKNYLSDIVKRAYETGAVETL
ncbi:MAG: DNA polymerase I, partial [Clostridia bacterium]|nr:DNA polymerase I [Clostridia bacterium]